MERLVSYLRLPSDVKDDRWPLVGAAVVGVAIVWTALLRSKSKKRGHPLPPGPKGLPVVGNLLQIPIEHPWLVYNEWKKEYGDMIYLNAMGQGILILNSLTTIDDLLTKRATNYSDRVQSALIPLTKIGWAFSVMNYGPWWRDHRRDFHRFFNNTQIPNYYPVIEEETLTFLRKLVADPKDFREQARLLFGSIIMRLSYGVEDLEYNKVLMEASETILQDFMEYSAPGRLLVTTFPSLRHVPSWFPGAGWRRITDRLAKLNDELVGRPFDEMKERVRSGTQGDYINAAAKLFEDLPEEGSPNRAHQETVARNVAAQAYLAGADTTLSASYALFLALAMHPEVQRKAQAEIDAVVGNERLPTFADMDRLPYVQAIIKEVSRWHSVVPLCVPHMSTEDDVYNGYYIPAKTIILSNTWSVMHDPEVFEDPETFRPERYLKDGKLDPSVLDPEAAVFGYGRRICPGRHLSHESLLLFTACLLATFDIKPSLDEAGNPKPLALRVASSLVTTPLPFECDFSIRSSKHATLL